MRLGWPSCAFLLLCSFLGACNLGAESARAQTSAEGAAATLTRYIAAVSAGDEDAAYQLLCTEARATQPRQLYDSASNRGPLIGSVRINYLAKGFVTGRVTEVIPNGKDAARGVVEITTPDRMALLQAMTTSAVPSMAFGAKDESLPSGDTRVRELLRAGNVPTETTTTTVALAREGGAWRVCPAAEIKSRSRR